MTGWVDSILEDKRRHRSFNQERVKEEAAFGVYNLMESQGVSRAELARRIGRSRSFITKVLGGSHNLTLGTLADLYFALGHFVHFTTGQDITEVHTPGEQDVRGITEEPSICFVFIEPPNAIVSHREYGEAEPESAADLDRLYGSGHSWRLRGAVGDAPILCFDTARSADTAGDGPGSDQYVAYQGDDQRSVQNV